MLVLQPHYNKSDKTEKNATCDCNFIIIISLFYNDVIFMSRNLEKVINLGLI